jgi:phosphoserine phosphatase
MPAPRFVVTLLGDALPPRFVEEVESALSRQGLRVEARRTLGLAIVSALELQVTGAGAVEWQAVNRELEGARARWPGLDAIVQRESAYRQPRRVLVMDMDSTLIQIETMNEIAALAGIADRVTPITTRANAGTVDFDESLRQRVALLDGFPEDRLKALAETVPLTPGAELLMRTVRRHGHKTAVVSAGFTYFCDHFKTRLGLDHVYSNTLEVVGGRLTGRLLGPIINACLKGELLQRIVAAEGLPLEAAVAIGDGANDVVMLARAGLGIAFNGKPTARDAAGAVVTQKTLAAVLYLLGLTDDDINPSRDAARSRPLRNFA